VRDYLREQSAGGLIVSSWRLYLDHFGVLFLICLVPVLPGALLSGALASSGVPDVVAAVAAVGVEVTTGLLLFAAMTVAVSDVCLGQAPSVGRAFGRLRGQLGPLATTYLLRGLLLVTGLVLLVLPGVAAAVMTLFAIPAVVLEGRAGAAAIERSTALGRGYHLRNLAIWAVMAGSLVALVVTTVLMAATVGAVAELDLENALGVGLLLGLGTAAAAPMAFIPTVLMYYDLRVRKESVDVATFPRDPG